MSHMVEFTHYSPANPSKHMKDVDLGALVVNRRFLPAWFPLGLNMHLG